MMRITPHWTALNPAMQESSLQNPGKGRLHTELALATAVTKITQKLLYMAPLDTSPTKSLRTCNCSDISWLLGAHQNTLYPSFIQHSYAEIHSPFEKSIQRNHFPTNKQEE